MICFLLEVCTYLYVLGWYYILSIYGFHERNRNEKNILHNQLSCNSRLFNKRFNVINFTQELLGTLSMISMRVQGLLKKKMGKLNWAEKIALTKTNN